MTVRFQTSLPTANGTDIRCCLLWRFEIPTRITMTRTVRLDYERWAVRQISEVEILRVVIEFPEGSINRSPFKRCGRFLDCGCHRVPVLAPSYPTRKPPLVSRGSCLSLALPPTWHLHKGNSNTKVLMGITPRSHEGSTKRDAMSQVDSVSTLLPRLLTVNMITKISGSLPRTQRRAIIWPHFWTSFERLHVLWLDFYCGVMGTRTRTSSMTKS